MQGGHLLSVRPDDRDTPQDGTVVEVIDPQIMVVLAENPDRQLLAGEVAERLSAALERLRGDGPEAPSPERGEVAV